MTRIQTILAATILCCLSSCATSSFEDVRDTRAKQDLEAKWINRKWQLTAYYPKGKTVEEVSRVLRLKGLGESNTGEFLYFSLVPGNPGTMKPGNHLMTIESDKDKNHVRFHCIGLNSAEEVVVYWEQYQEVGKHMVIEKLQVPKSTPKSAEQSGADQPATKPADKLPVKVQPSTPTPKVAPR